MQMEDLEVGCVYLHDDKDLVQINTVKDCGDCSNYCFITYTHVNRVGWGSAYTHKNDIGFTKIKEAQIV